MKIPVFKCCHQISRPDAGHAYTKTRALKSGKTEKFPPEYIRVYQGVFARLKT